LERSLASSTAVGQKRDSWLDEQNVVQIRFDDDRAPQPERWSDSDDQTKRDSLLRNTMENLCRDERAVLIRSIAGFSSDEIADYQGKSADAVEAQIARARRTLRKLFMHTRR
jgi:DNA-directed RNA polymerase specialized sigma24 family protein